MDTKKQVYALAFTIYGLSEYSRATGDAVSLEWAKGLYQDIEKHSYDLRKGGYLEALTREWNEIADLRLSDKDANEKKTMNTHLHVLEAYTNLYRIWPDKELAGKIRELIGVFIRPIIDPKTGHLVLFFTEDWERRSDIISYGHDIEASWLLAEAAEVLEDPPLLQRVQDLSVKIALASTGGLRPDGSMIYEFDRTQNHRIEERHWWVQAEAMVGFLHAWKLTGESHFYKKFRALWDFTREQIIDRLHGEWFWGVKGDGSLMKGEDKAGFWKCPYHNSRACIEIIRRLED
jgi:mannobiose 2-epimerase